MRHVPEVIAAVENDQTRQLGPFIIGGNYSSALLPFPDFTKPDTCPDDRATILAATVPDYSDPSSADPATFVHSILQTPREATGGYFTHSAQEIFKGFGVESQVVDQKFSEKYIPTCAFYSSPASILKPGGKRSPGVPDDLRTASLDEVKDYVKSAGRNTYHPTSTCAMLPREKGGVMDSGLRVWGTKGLRVVDASVIPIVSRANLQTTVYANAERESYLIKEDLARN
ncbi:GMC oxidoreductase [Aspergillus carbonarius ITEM 5010]|uniref:GMC oxidoreductase n=1 Tax=Aspergillus carbonarius (strain ITEM 5010) TaxID=602072 RepID=A0A1R3R8W7_ASPC5|nr:GMC oxidoreductase [Aspergillus carbonarius ITEM 5010]